MPTPPVPHDARPLRLALVGTLPPWKGISPYCEALTRALAATHTATAPVQIEFLDFEQLYPTKLYPGPAMQRAGESRPTDLPTNVQHRPVLHYRRPKDAFNLGRTLAADVLHVQFWSEFLAPAMAMLIDGFRAAPAGPEPRPVVMTLHNLAPHETTSGSLAKRIAQAWKKPFGAEVIRRADAWVVHYASGRGELAAQLPPGAGDRIHVIPHGLLEPRVARNQPMDRADARARLTPKLPGLNPAAPILLLFGNLRPYKGIAVALRALAQTRRDGPPAQMIVAGARWQDFDLAAHKHLATQLGLTPRVHWRVEFIPEADLADLLAAADALLLPYTHFDAMSGVASLGLRAGLPTIVSRVGGLPDMLPPAVAQHLAVPPNDPARLAAAIDRLLSDPALQAAAAHPPDSFLERFRWETVATATRALYASLRTLG